MIRRSITVLVTLPILASRASGQVRGVGAMDVSSAFGRDGTGPWLRESRVAPDLRAVSPFGFLRVNSLFVERGGSVAIPNTDVGALVALPAFSIFRLSFADDLDHAASTVDRRSQNALSAALSARIGATGFWVGGVGRSDFGTSTGGSGVARALRVGGWRVIHNAVLSVTSTSQRDRAWAQQLGTREIVFVDSVWTDTTGWQHYTRSRTVTDSSRVLRARTSPDVEARVDWASGRLGLTAQLARRSLFDSLGTHPLTWGRFDAVVLLGPRISLVVGGGALPPNEGRFTASRFASVGVRLSPAALLRPPLPAPVRPVATAFSVHALADGMYRLAIRVPSARSVDVSGDFNEWMPLALRETAPNLWEVTLPLTPGAHRINVRVDGDRWVAPPGLPAVDDEFNGRVGIVVVR